VLFPKVLADCISTGYSNLPLAFNLIAAEIVPAYTFYVYLSLNPAKWVDSCDVPVALPIINDTLADFLSLVPYVPFPIFILPLILKNGRQRGKGNNSNVNRFNDAFQILS
jgi:hypothetical protein